MRLKILLTVTVFLTFVIITSLIFIGNRSDNPNHLTNNPVIRALSPTPATPLEVASIEPVIDLRTITGITPITLTFSDSLDTSSLRYTTEPVVETYTTFSGPKVTFRSKTGWPPDQEIAIIVTSAKSLSGQTLNIPYKVVIKAPLPFE